MAITRVVWTDDSGAGTDGTILNNANLITIYNSIETTWAADSYTPTWGNSGTANTLGNGTLVGTYFKIGKLIHFNILLTWGSTTASGSGSWTFTFPATSAGTVVDVGFGRAFDTGTNTFLAAARYASSTTFDVVSINAASTTALHALITATVPMTWATGDTLSIAGWYIAS